MDKGVIQYHFEELIKTLITLSSSADRQIYIIGMGHTGVEMVNDFDAYYRDFINHYLELGFLTLEQSKSLNKFNEYLDGICNSQSDGFFYDRLEVKTNVIWEEIRTESKKLLMILNKDHLDIEVIREIKDNIEITKMKLINT